MNFYQYFMNLHSSLILITLVVLTLSTPKLPTSFCDSHPSFHVSTISPGELLTYDMENFISGYNLKFTVQEGNSFASLSQKIQELDRKRKPFNDINIISHHIEDEGNSWGKYSYMLSEDEKGEIHFSYGVFRDADNLPSINSSVTISKDNKNVRCFSAVLFVEENLAIVDCVHINNEKLYAFENYFYYIDLENQKINYKVATKTYAKFQNITKRKILKLQNKQKGDKYLLRAYEAEGVDAAHKDNTIIELFQANNPYNLKLIKIIDKQFFGIQTLSIVDIEVYRNSLFFLDPVNGFYQLDIMKNQDLIIRGRYNIKGFTRFSLYQSYLKTLVIGLVNSQTIYEIDWSNTASPELINKYSLMQDTHVSQIMINDRYIVVQGSSNSFQLNYTWILTKGSRTYGNAYHVISHQTNDVGLQFDRKNDKLITISDEGIVLYKIDEVRLNLQIQEDQQIGTGQKVIIQGISTDLQTQKSAICALQIKIHIVEPTNQLIYPTQLRTPDVYSINKPLQTQIDLNRYAVGPNITYNILNISSSGDIPKHWFKTINKIQSNLENRENTKFMYVQNNKQVGYAYYIQSQDHEFQVFNCFFHQQMFYCRLEWKFQHDSEITAFSTNAFMQQDANYFYAFVLGQDDRVVKIQDFIYGRKVSSIQTDSPITSLASSKQYLYVLKGHIKTIEVYSLQKCRDQKASEKLFQIKLKEIQNFQPQELITHRSHPNLLFIKCIRSVIIFDVNFQEQTIQVLDTISTATFQHYKLAVTEDKLIIASNPNIIELYSIQQIYSKGKALFLKKLPTYHYFFQHNKMKMTSSGNFLYLNVIDPTTKRQTVLVYNTNLPAAHSLYQTIPLSHNQHQNELLMSAVSSQTNLLSIIRENNIQVFNVAENPQLVIQNSTKDFTFDLIYENTQSSYSVGKITVRTINLPQGFTETEEFRRTFKGLKLEAGNNYTWDNKNWFRGHVTNYNYSCDECEKGDKVEIKQNVNFVKTNSNPSRDFFQTAEGGVSLDESIFKFHPNGSVKAVLNLPGLAYLQRCQKIRSDDNGAYLVSACEELGLGLKLYITLTASFKTWTQGPFLTKAYSVRNLQVTKDIIMIADTSKYPQYKFGNHQILLFALVADIYPSEEFEELQIIDEKDLLTVPGYQGSEVFIANSYLSYFQDQEIYRLYVTEVSNGLFIVDFTYKVREKEINIIKITFIDLKQFLIQNGLHLPPDATFQAVVQTERHASPLYQTQTIIVTVKNYDNIEIEAVYNTNRNLIATNLKKIYKRYAFCEVTNQINYSPGYVAINYFFPYPQDISTPRTQLVAVYDTSDYQQENQKGYQERYMMGSYDFKYSSQTMVAFMTTNDHPNKRKVGLVLKLLYSQKFMRYFQLSRNLSAIVRSQAKTQTLQLTPLNDFESKTFKIPVIGSLKRKKYLKREDEKKELVEQ